MNRPHPTQGFALLAVLWCCGIMSVTVIGLITFVSLQLDEDILRSRQEQARLLAESGLAIGLHPSVAATDPLLHKEFPHDQHYEVTLMSEGARLNLNALLKDNQTEVLLRLWTAWGVPLEEAQALNDALLDWVDADETKRLNGAERADYAALGLSTVPANRPFRSLEEVSLVLGFARIEALKPNWKDYFTLWSDGKLDLNEAPAELIAPMANLSLTQAEAFVKFRDPDGVPRNADDIHFKDLEAAAKSLGLYGDSLAKVKDRLTVTSTITRIESRGIVSRQTHTLVVVTKKDGKEPTYLLWQEY